jgi:hypothetical protein
MSSINNKNYNIKPANILWMGLLTGILDSLAAIAWNYKIKPAIIFKFIASGIFGKAAFKGGADMILWGLLFHFIIAYSFTAAFYLLYPAFIKTLKNKYITAVIFALITWLITNLVITPLSQIGWRSMNVTTIISGFVILIFTIGLPIVLIADRRKVKIKKKI